jgi:aldose 1-epimerase
MTDDQRELSRTKVTVKQWGTLGGQEAQRILLESPTGERCEVSNLGASLLRFWARDGHNLVLGYETLDEYVSDPHYIGMTVGRVANRIAEAKFELGGRHFRLGANDGAHHLHGGPEGFSTRLWATDLTRPGAVRFHLHSPDEDGGYPGALDVSVTYELKDHALLVTMEGFAHDDSLINLAHHSYFNLEDDGDVLGHRLTLACSTFTPGMPPDGTVREVAGTAFDFRAARSIGEGIQRADGAGSPGGYDHNFLIDGSEAYSPASSADAPRRHVATLEAPRSGRVMKLFSNQPGVQLYTGNFLDGTRRGVRGILEKHGGLCLETQAPPNAINVPALRPMVSLPRGARYRHEMICALCW